MPEYWSFVAEKPLFNLLSGLCSDLSLVAIVSLLYVISNLGSAKNYKKIAKSLLGISAAIFVLCSAVHFRYIEHFGVSLRPIHLISLKGFNDWGAGSQMVFESWRFYVLLGTSFFGAALLSSLKRKKRTFSSRPKNVIAKIMIPLICFVVFNACNIYCRKQDGVHRELRYNFLATLWYNFKEFNKKSILQLPKNEDLAQIKSFFGANKAWLNKHDFPLLQDKFISKEPSLVSNKKIYQELKDFLLKEQKEKGPWNVLLVIQESLRANELSALGNKDPLYQQLTKNMQETFAKGILFTETYGAGFETKIGQIASQCSLPATPSYPLMVENPLANIVCLPDIFANLDYDTFFFHADDNHFDNQEEFYHFHKVHHIYGKDSFSKSTARGGLGYSDHALFNLSLDELAKYKKPFFATILTLTNHAPLVLPSDAPAFIDPKLAMEDQILAYVDWAWGDFYRKFSAKFQHTITIFVADHGTGRGEGMQEIGLTKEQLKRIGRIPLVFLIDNLPASLEGLQIDNLSSQIDIAPTLLELLDAKLGQHAMLGDNLFSRENPVLISFTSQNYVLKKNVETGIEISNSESSNKIVEWLSGILAYNKLFIKN